MFLIEICILSIMIAVASASFATPESIYVGTFAFCSNTCTSSSNSACSGRCITFRDNIGNKNIRTHQFLAEVCWNINTCAEFPKFFAFQTDNDCSNGCEVNAFPGFSKKELNSNNDLYYAKGYNMMCIEEASTDSPLPNICSLAKPFAI